MNIGYTTSNTASKIRSSDGSSSEQTESQTGAETAYESQLLLLRLTIAHPRYLAVFSTGEKNQGSTFFPL